MIKTKKGKIEFNQKFLDFLENWVIKERADLTFVAEDWINPEKPNL